jgi:hypothetical protein
MEQQHGHQRIPSAGCLRALAHVLSVQRGQLWCPVQQVPTLAALHGPVAPWYCDGTVAGTVMAITPLAPPTAGS